MLDTISRAGAGAIDIDDKSVVGIYDQEFDDKSVVDDEDWFAAAACQFYPDKPGAALHYLTGFDLRTCQRYTAAEKPTKPPAYFLRALLRSTHGSQWLAAVMDGCEQPWWIELQTARDFCSKFKIEPR